MTLHFFTAKGKETTEGAEDSAVQYDEATATRLGLKFKKAAKDETPAGPSLSDYMALAARDGSEADAPKVEPIKVPTEPEPAVEPEPVKVAEPVKPARPRKRASKK